MNYSLLHSKSKVLGLICLLIYFFAGSHLLYHYSLKEGLYFEFSLLGLLLLGISGLSRSTRLAIATLGFILPQVVVWFLEAILFCFSNESFFGLFEARFHPAISISDFYIYQYPLEIGRAHV